jgi:hypothetical protein
MGHQGLVFDGMMDLVTLGTQVKATTALRNRVFATYHGHVLRLLLFTSLTFT